MKTTQFLLMLLTTFFLVAPAPQTQAGVVLFRDNFNNENGGVGAASYTNFSNWMVMANNYDLLPISGPNPHPNNGLHVGLGSGWLAAKQGLTLEPGNYQLRFDLAGRGGSVPNGVFYTFDNLFSDFAEVPGTSGFVTITRDFSVPDTRNTLLFFDSGDNPGLLDNVEIIRLDGTPRPVVPEPTTALLLGACMLGAAGWCWLRRRRVDRLLGERGV
jgi:hypothetical protein